MKASPVASFNASDVYPNVQVMQLTGKIVAVPFGAVSNFIIHIMLVSYN